jgi:hypothetical protein
MRRIQFFVSLFAAALLQGCSDNKAGTPAAEANKVTQTRMNDIDSLEGTISDEMIISDDANDEAALEPADSDTDTKTLPGKPPIAPAASKSDDTAQEAAQDESNGSDVSE